MEQTEGFETLSFKLQAPVNHREEDKTGRVFRNVDCKLQTPVNHREEDRTDSVPKR
jgi:hypothetical protein